MSIIIGLCGSLRRGSFNQRLLEAAAAMAPRGTSIQPESIREIPLYDADAEEAQGVPMAVERLKNRIAQADGLLIVTPEYNASFPGVLKNAIDWLSRPAEDITRVFRGRPVALIGATTGTGGTILAQAAWLPVFRLLGMRPWFERTLQISDAAHAFDSQGALVEAAMRHRLRTFIEAYAHFLDGQRHRHEEVDWMMQARPAGVLESGEAR